MPHGAIPFPFGDCRICNDKATGVHYGVATCEGCKGFYKRSIPKGDKYRCYFGGACIISPQNRNRCKACRFQKCVEQGMAVEAVKMGRIPKIQKDKALEEAAAIKKEDPESSETLSGTGSCLLNDSGYSEFTEPHNRTPQALKRKHTWGGQVDDSKDAVSGSANGDKKRDAAPGSSSGEERTNLDTCNRDFHSDGMQNQGTFPSLQSNLPEHAWRVPGQFTMQQHHQNLQSPEKRQNMGKEEISTQQSVSKLTLPHADVPVKQEFSFPSQEMQPYYCAKPGDSIQVNAKKEVVEEQMIDSVAGCHDKASICAAVGSSEKRLSSPVLNEGDGRFSPGFGGKLRNYSPGLIEVLFSQMVESENGNIEKAKEKLLKRLASTLRQDKNQLSSATSFLTTSSSITLPESLHPRGRPTSDLEFACKLHHSNSTEAHIGGPSLSSISCSVSYTTSYSGQHDSLSVQHEDVSEHYDQPAAYPADADTKPFRISQPGTSNFQEPNFSVSCSQFERSVDSSATLVHTQKNYNCLFQETSSRSLDTSSTHSKSWHENEKLHNTFAQNNMHPAVSHLESGNTGNHHSFPSDVDLFTHDRNTFGHGSALSDQMTHCYRPQVSDCPGVMCPTSNFVSSQSHSQVFSEDYLNQCKDLLRDTDEVLSFDSNSSLSSGKQTPLPEENSWEETMQLLEKNIISKFELIRSRQEARDKYFKENLGRKSPSPLPQLKDMDALWTALMKSLESLNGSIIGFCKEVPGFGELDHFDQEILLKHAYYDIWILTQSEFFIGGESYLLLSDGTFYTRVLMEQVIGKEITDTMHRFAQQFNALGLSHREKALLCSIQLTTIPQNHHDLQKPEDVQKLNSFYLDLLVHAVSRNHGGASSRVLVDIFRMVPLLAEVNRMQREIIGSLKIDNPSFKK